MGDYRAYILAIDGHRFVWAKDFFKDHPNDAAAVDAAKALTGEHEVEVWQDSRLVARLHHGEEEMSPALVPGLPIGRAEPISSSKASKVAPESASKPNPGPAVWRRLLIPWS